MSQFIVEVDTFAERAAVAARSAGLAEDVFASLGRALLDRAGRGDPVPEDATTSGEPGRSGVVVGVAVADTGSGPRIRRWRDGVVARELGRLRAGKLEELTLQYSLSGLAGVSLEVVIAPHGEDSGLAKAFHIRLAAAWPGAREVFEEWAPGFFRRAAVALDAATGYITCDDAGGVSGSPYETWASRSYAFALAKADTQLRGYYWANLLGPGHLDVVGGAGAITAAVPGAVIEPLTPGGYPLLVQLPGTPSTVAWEDRAALYEVFSPALPAPRSKYSAFPPDRR